MNFLAILNQSLIGKFLRFPLRFIPKKMVFPILQGPLKGKKWIVGAGVHEYWLGIYEYEKQKLFARMIRETTVVYDVGAHVGFYTLLASELVGPRGKVVAFEPLPRNLQYLKKHLMLNLVQNVTVIEAAVADRSGICFFNDGTNSFTGCLSAKGNRKVKMFSLDDLVSDGEIPRPDCIKIDVEGAELMVLKGAESILDKYHPTIFLATHGIEMHKQCCEFLKSRGYDLQSINKKDINETDEILALKEK